MTGTIDGLKGLHAALVDCKADYEKALANGADGSLAPLFRDLIVLRKRHNAELDRLLRTAGEMPDESASYSPTAHRTVLKERSMRAGLGESILPGLIDSEERILKQYDDMLESALPTLTAGVLRLQRAAIAAKIARMKELQRLE
ncbi:MAG: PA2169 family four-helix-bundle protein [Xanthobacteraceae bacterium]|nr:PA2169 family four-helix-bundle protein [Xanthobacteraceae bacterium]